MSNTFIKISEAEMSALEKDLKSIAKSLDDKTLRKIMRKSTKPLIIAARARAPVANRIVKRYSTAKLNKKLRAPKGSGNVVGETLPGTLGKSIGNIPLRRAKRSVLVGARAGKRRKYDGYYAHFVEFETKVSGAKPFMGPAWEQTKGAVLVLIIINIRKIINNRIK